MVDVPDTCLKVSRDCPVEGTLYGYEPSLAANAFFAAIFGLCMVLQFIFGFKYRTWTYMIGVGVGCLGEMIGYIGRIMLHNNPYDELGFQIQICCLIIAPAWISAGMYLSLKHIVINFGERWSRIRPNWYTWIFICADTFSLILQGAGGGLAATGDPGSKIQDVGTDLMIAGVILQVICLAFFGYFLGEYGFRTHRHRNELTLDSMNLFRSTKFRLFMAGIVTAFVTIFARCVYRIPELTGGWGNPLMRNEPEFIALEGVMILIAAVALTVFHPGFCFPAMCRYNIKKRSAKSLGGDSENEMVNRG